MNELLATSAEAAALIRNQIINPDSVRVLEMLDAKRARCGDDAGDALTLYFAALTSIITLSARGEVSVLARNLALMSLYHLAKAQGVTVEDSNALHKAYMNDGEDAIARGDA